MSGLNSLINLFNLLLDKIFEFTKNETKSKILIGSELLNSIYSTSKCFFNKVISSAILESSPPKILYFVLIIKIF